jgi:class 3 adenylate cyclase
MRWITALTNADGSLMGNLFSSDDPLVFVGSAENEILRDGTMRNLYARHVSEVPRSRITEQTIEAWENGAAGWAFWTGRLDYYSTGKTIIGRITLVFTLEKGIWKVQHAHNSIPIANIEAMGYVGSALDDLLSAAETSDLEIGKTGIAAVMFTDIVDSSRLASLVGDTAWTKRVNEHIKTLNQHIENAGGQMIKSLGDGTMTTFSSARAAMASAQSIQGHLAQDATEPNLSVRIGIHTGDVIQAGNDFFGTVVNKAARVAAAAGAGEIRVSDETRLMVGKTSDFEFEDTATVPLKGLEGEHVIHRLKW